MFALVISAAWFGAALGAELPSPAGNPDAPQWEMSACGWAED